MSQTLDDLEGGYLVLKNSRIHLNSERPLNSTNRHRHFLKIAILAIILICVLKLSLLSSDNFHINAFLGIIDQRRNYLWQVLLEIALENGCKLRDGCLDGYNLGVGLIEGLLHSLCISHGSHNGAERLHHCVCISSAKIWLVLH